MKLIPLKCEFCGGRLDRASSDTVVCRFCNMAYLVHEEPKEPIAIPAEEPQVVAPEDQDEPCEAEQEIRRLMAESESEFWQSLPDEPKLEEVGGEFRSAESDNLLMVPCAFAFISMGIGSAIASGNRNVVLYWIGGICFAVACVLGFRAVATLIRVNLLIDQFVKQQTAYRNQIQELHNHRDLLERLP